VESRLDPDGRSSPAPIALVTLATPPTILPMTATQQHAAGKPRPRDPAPRDPRDHANRTARAGRPAQRATGKPRPASTAQRASAPSRQRAITPARHHAITPSRHHAITPSRHHAITPSTVKPTRTARPARTSELRTQTVLPHPATSAVVSATNTTESTNALNRQPPKKRATALATRSSLGSRPQPQRTGRTGSRPRLHIGRIGWPSQKTWFRRAASFRRRTAGSSGLSRSRSQPTVMKGEAGAVPQSRTSEATCQSPTRRLLVGE
jgi:hypothetical protein